MSKSSLPFLRKNKISPILTDSTETSECSSEISEQLFASEDIKEFISNAAQDQSEYALNDLLEILNVKQTSIFNNKEVKYAFVALQKIINPKKSLGSFIRNSLNMPNKVKPENITKEHCIDIIYEEVSKYLDKAQGLNYDDIEPKPKKDLHSKFKDNITNTNNSSPRLR